MCLLRTLRTGLKLLFLKRVFRSIYIYPRPTSILPEPVGKGNHDIE